jgi:hypothetical protein
MTESWGWCLAVFAGCSVFADLSALCGIKRRIRSLWRNCHRSQRRADFSELAGKWVDDPAFDEIIASQRQIDPDKSK